MRKVIVISIIIAAWSVRGQTESGAAGGTTTAAHGVVQINPQLNGQSPQNSSRGNATYPANRTYGAYGYTNVPPNRGYFTNQNSMANTNSMPYGATNQFGHSPNSYGWTVTNSAAETNSATYNASITNTLSAMSPAQAQNVVQFQAELNALQQVAVNTRGAQNVNQAIQQNPQIQMQLQQVETQIGNLAQGQVKPLSDTVQRLATDLLRADVHAPLTENQQMVLATAINQMANSETMTPLQIENAINAVQANLEGAGVPRWVSYDVAADLRAMAFELQPTLQQQ